MLTDHFGTSVVKMLYVYINQVKCMDLFVTSLFITRLLERPTSVGHKLNLLASRTLLCLVSIIRGHVHGIPS